MLDMEGYWLEGITGMLLSSLMNTEKKTVLPSASTLDDGVVFKLLQVVPLTGMFYDIFLYIYQ